MRRSSTALTLGTDRLLPCLPLRASYALCSAHMACSCRVTFCRRRSILTSISGCASHRLTSGMPARRNPSTKGTAPANAAFSSLRSVAKLFVSAISTSITVTERVTTCNRRWLPSRNDPAPSMRISSASATSKCCTNRRLNG